MHPRTKDLLAAAKEAARGARWPVTAFAIAAICFLALAAIGPIVQSLPPFPSPIASDARTARVAVEPSAEDGATAETETPGTVRPTAGGPLDGNRIGEPPRSGPSNGSGAAGSSASGDGVFRVRPHPAPRQPGSPPPPPPSASAASPPPPPIPAVQEPVRGVEPEFVATGTGDDGGKKVKKAKKAKLPKPRRGNRGDKGEKHPPVPAASASQGSSGKDKGDSGGGKKAKGERGGRRNGNGQDQAGDDGKKDADAGGGPSDGPADPSNPGSGRNGD
ncbi:MAG: hypothetical protein M3327_03315 [Actinomycetota bacterium]|nr:hypothetical protein [Actinomycetota bacterium]